MSYTIYPSGQPVYGTKSYATNFVASAQTGVATMTNPATPAVTAAATYVGSAAGTNGSTVYGTKQAGSLNANGVLTVAPGKNTPLS